MSFLKLWNNKEQRWNTHYLWRAFICDKIRIVVVILFLILRWCPDIIHILWEGHNLMRKNITVKLD